VNLPKNWKGGSVVEGSFAHLMLRQYDKDARASGLPQLEGAIIKWEETTPTQVPYGHDGAKRVMINGIPASALHYAKAQYNEAKRRMANCGIPIDKLRIKCAPITGSQWCALSSTHVGHHESSQKMHTERVQTMGLLFKLRGFW
jgi:hypothetical protein